MLRFLRLGVLVVVLALLVPACGDDGDDASGSTTSDTPPATSGDTTGTSTEETGTSTDPGPEPIRVERLFDGEGPRDAAVQGLVFADAASTRICGVLMESFPPQCGWPWIVIANPDGLDVELDEEQSIAWSPAPVTLVGRFDGDRFILDSGPDVAPTAEDRALVDAFVRFAVTGDGADQVPWADQVALGLADRIVRTVDAADLADPIAWEIDEEAFRARVGPFSALELVSVDHATTIGAHAHCASPPVPAPEGFAAHRRVSLQPVGTTSCLQWSTVDLFVDESGRIHAVTLDLFEP